MVPVLVRPLVVRGALRLVLGWIRSRLGLADAPLRPLGVRREPLVLDSGPVLVAGLGVVGVCAGLCQLVPARFRQPPRRRVHARERATVWTMVGVDGRAGALVRTGVSGAWPCRRRRRDRADDL